MRKIGFNEGWTFCNDLKKTKPSAVTLPHDAMLAEKRLPGMKNGAAAGFFPGGKYIYTKSFTGWTEWKNRSVMLEFEGIYMKSSVFLNGELLGGHIYGYTGFYVDLTDKIRTGEVNELRVIADNSQTPNSRWYTGSGIYRNVNLYVGNRKHIHPEGVKVVTRSIHPAIVQVVTENEKYPGTDVGINIYNWTKSGRGQFVASGKGADCQIEIPEARLWDDIHPNLYEVSVVLMEGDQILDQQSVITGIRMLDWSAENGIRINGKAVKLRGGCVHHDNGILGACAHPKVEYRKVRIMKETGFNAIRSAHNPMSKAMLSACDELGMYVMDEAFDQWRMGKVDYDYSLYFDEEWEKDLTAMVIKDRNHPSVIMYSIGNEIADTGSADGAAISRRLSDCCRKLDPTRPTTNGINPVVSSMGGALNNSKVTKDDTVDPYEEKGNAQATASLLANIIATAAPFVSKMMCKPKKVEKLLKAAFDEVDIVGYNYAEGCYKTHHEWNPGRIMVGTETYPQSLAERWPMIKENPYIVGDFMWTAFDYLGEAGVGVPIYGKSRGGFNRPYPCASAGCGVIDLLGHVDTEAVHAAIAWEQYEKPYIAVCPVNHSGEKYFFGMWRGTDARHSWSWEGMEGKKAQVEVYSSGSSVELFLNGVSQGKKPLVMYKAEFELPYQKGTLRAVSYDGSGKEMGEDSLTSAGKETRLCVMAEETRLKADESDMTFVSVGITDENGIVRMLSDRRVQVCVEGCGILAGIGSANPVTKDSYVGDSCMTWYGRMGFYVRSNGTTGAAKVTVSAEGIPPVSTEIEFV